MANLSAKIRLPALVLTLLAISSSVQGTTINVRSQCSSVLAACDQSQGTEVTCYVLQNGGSHLLDVGASWEGGVIWGFPGDNPDPVLGNKAKPEADLAEFTIGLNGQDSYDLSNVNAYNLPLKINPTVIGDESQPNGLHCGSPSCTIPDLNGFCKSPNTILEMAAETPTGLATFPPMELKPSRKPARRLIPTPRTTRTLTTLAPMAATTKWSSAHDEMNLAWLQKDSHWKHESRRTFTIVLV